MRKKSYLDVDWVQLGIYGWEIDESGAGFDGGEYRHGWNYCHLDRVTLDIHLFGDGAFCKARLHELANCQVPGLAMRWQTVTGDTYTAGSGTAAALRLIA